VVQLAELIQRIAGGETVKKKNAVNHSAGVSGAEIWWYPFNKAHNLKEAQRIEQFDGVGALKEKEEETGV